ncbi:hypothetical protein E6O75_ATG08499 [Venturia nashicola]|uniref:Uncharacterized protein n=1 Tax=Venturia nashicola TaxID=86259 RepID=A0A4Z1P1H1_9PEZI|nr:hypothetical protein E6O75_ATG08499 [Venturia nashicola]
MNTISRWHRPRTFLPSYMGFWDFRRNVHGQEVKIGPPPISANPRTIPSARNHLGLPNLQKLTLAVIKRAVMLGGRAIGQCTQVRHISGLVGKTTGCNHEECEDGTHAAIATIHFNTIIPILQTQNSTSLPNSTPTSTPHLLSKTNTYPSPNNPDMKFLTLLFSTLSLLTATQALAVVAEEHMATERNGVCPAGTAQVGKTKGFHDE